MHYFLEHFVWARISWWLLVEAFYVGTLRRVLLACSRENGAARPGWLWVELLPVIGVAWQFVNVMVLGKSLEAECKTRGSAFHRPGQRLGLTTFTLQILSIAFLLPANGGSGPFLAARTPSVGVRPRPEPRVELSALGGIGLPTGSYVHLGLVLGSDVPLFQRTGHRLVGERRRPTRMTARLSDMMVG